MKRYPLRPELVESAMYLYQRTRDPSMIAIGEAMMFSIQSVSKTKCGYATISDVENHSLENRMESFFLSETVKYLYLLFDTENFIHNPGSVASVVNTSGGQCVLDAGGYIFNTEAHPIDPAALACCSEATSSAIKNQLAENVFQLLDTNAYSQYEGDYVHNISQVGRTSVTKGKTMLAI